MVADVFDPWLKRWALVADGAPIITPGSRLLPVRLNDRPAMLKVALDVEEKYGNRLMTWWDGDGAAHVLAHHQGERGFDYANLICNPDLPTATDPARFRRQLDVIVQAARLDRRRLLQWVLAFAGLSAAWFLEDDALEQASGQLKVAQIAASMLDA
ncbi:aminoglycoside phosphotransferase family protein [Pseudomonas fluorescens]|uniref:Uncharacterized protein n=1 Tax=Pseudomonas fluorescens TaxID=294 RepID=A0A5E6VHP1_PSEFL|nr:aminoglycoside phosphotransferase family protein [Pseudomonas fluorescens]VVN11856.1 hypothetical protein PS655_03888 [Pseudomonas fluorescens]